MRPDPHPRPKCWRCQDWREVLTRDGKTAKPCPECQTTQQPRTTTRTHR